MEKKVDKKRMDEGRCLSFKFYFIFSVCDSDSRNDHRSRPDTEIDRERRDDSHGGVLVQCPFSMFAGRDGDGSPKDYTLY